MGTARSPAFDLAVLGSGPYGTFLWGESRAVLNRVLFAMVRAIDSHPLWLELGALQPEGGDPGPIELDWISSDHVFLADEPSIVNPQDAVANTALLGLVRADESSVALTRLADFVRLPPIAQEIISRIGNGESRHALAIANSDRVRSAYPSTVEGVRPIVTAFLDSKILPVLAARGTPGPGRMAFDFVFEVRATDLAHWRDGSLVPEKSPDETRLRVGEPIPLSQIPKLEEAFSSTPGRK